MGRKWFAMGALVLALSLAACGGSDDPAAPSPSPTVPVDANADLVNVRCEQDEEGRWLARGRLRNESEAPVGYLITVFAGPAGGEVEATVHEVLDVPAGEVESFAIEDIAAAEGAESCLVRAEYIGD